MPDSWLLSVGALALIGAGIIGWIYVRRPRHASGVAILLRANGAQRCLAAIALLRRLGNQGDPLAIATCWDAIELPLLQALPDCPPGSKGELIAALDSCALAVSNRELTKRIMTLRDSLVG